MVRGGTIYQGGRNPRRQDSLVWVAFSRYDDRAGTARLSTRERDSHFFGQSFLKHPVDLRNKSGIASRCLPGDAVAGIAL